MLHYFVRLMYLRILALTERPWDISAESGNQKPINVETKSHKKSKV